MAAAPAAQQATVVVVRLVEVHVEADRSHMAEADPMVVVHTEDMVA